MILVYGANGYTGALVARRLVERGHRPVLAGRSRAPIARLAEELGLSYRIFHLEDPAALDAGLEAVRVVAHCAGPFAHTARAMADAAVRVGAHYLDITGEWSVFEALRARHERARQRGVMLLPGAGFDVVPSDCLAAHLQRRLPSASHLALGIQASSRLSAGTARTALALLGAGGVVRRAGRLEPVRLDASIREIDFGRGPRPAWRLPLADVASAYHSTGIPNIEVYAAVPRGLVPLRAALAFFPALSRLPGLRAALAAWARRRTGPDERMRAERSSRLWGEVVDPAGRRAVSRLRTPEAYQLTVETMSLMAERALDGQAPPGYQTPASAYGPDFILELAGVERIDVE